MRQNKAEPLQHRSGGRIPTVNAIVTPELNHDQITSPQPTFTLLLNIQDLLRFNAADSFGAE
jgi:hypothetical protein